MRVNGLYTLLCLFAVTTNLVADQEHLMKHEHLISEDYLTQHLRESRPRLILTGERLVDLKKQITSDPVIRHHYETLKANAQRVMTQDLLERKMEGKRLLGISREMLYRMNMLGMVFSLERDGKVLERINRELIAVCAFPDWNPSHYLDVAEMSLAVALALDWTAGELPETTVELARQALIEKGIQPSWQKQMWWERGNNNWNQVCHAGMIAAAIEVAEREPELAAKTIERALQGIPYALAEYAPDGVYPEGASYWGYGTTFTVLTIEMLRSALNNDFGIADSPGFMESALFRTLCCAPSGAFFNFADCGDRRGSDGDITLAWFAAETGNALYYEKDRFLKTRSTKTLSRSAGAALVWMSRFRETDAGDIPEAWKGDGANPVVIFRGDGYYFGGKGGRGTVNHGNMDAGTFVFELDGVRWVVDPGNQRYYDLEKTGFTLWGKTQDAERWTLLTKNNFGHSTLTVDGKLHVVDGMAEIVAFAADPLPRATVDLGPTFHGQLASAVRTFERDTPSSLLIEDRIEPLPDTERVTWQLITRADVEITPAGAMLTQAGKRLKLENCSHPEIPIKVVSLDPPPLELDRHISGLKRLELVIPSPPAGEGRIEISVRLSGTSGDR
ncbi:MAG: hypothetical protein HN919_03215 [Verrucomicrobia bacterium]|nr:hypothetical protein [Verrucomicrobiota bacterium]MBT7065287.1 hypothetical protein [Verrucomicrobiota bacterium]MBT7698759.1 hypothetical protein [Verrucomicrobiota bacterium]